jgi:hypothetical protein
MAEDALKQWVAYLIEKKQEIPAASEIDKIDANPGEFVNLIRVDVRDEYAVRRTVSIPKWMDDEVIEAGLSLSRILQDALNERLHSA